MFTPYEDTLARAGARLALIAQHSTPRRHALPPFEQQAVPGGPWQVIPYGTYWGAWNQSFVLRGQYQIPSEWPAAATIALDLQIGDAGDSFNVHPEALIFIDEVAFTAVDVRHTRLTLP
ncbi:MAG: hypothetical protein MUE40_20700, partial [Anaerolineae bacterium]|nr:hypothetical protein [Anaerolineae bacterium]